MDEERHPNSALLPPPARQVAANEELSVCIQTAGPDNSKARKHDDHAFAILVMDKTRHLLTRFGSRSPSDGTSVARGCLGGFLTTLEWLEKFAPLNVAVVYSTHDYLYEHLRNQGDKWAATGQRSGKKPVAHLALVRRVMQKWGGVRNLVDIQRWHDTHGAEELANLARAIRDYGGELPKPESGGNLQTYAVAAENASELSRHNEREWKEARQK